MPDLTLDEYRNIPEEKLRKILKEEAQRLFGSDRTDKRHKKGPENQRSLIKSDSRDKTKGAIERSLPALLSLPSKFLLNLYPT